MLDVPGHHNLLASDELSTDKEVSKRTDLPSINAVNISSSGTLGQPLVLGRSQKRCGPTVKETISGTLVLCRRLRFQKDLVVLRI